MIYDLNKSENIGQKNNEEYDICIIGSGAAGITIAQSLNKYNLKIALIEGGSHEFSRQSQDIYKGKLIGDPYYPLDVARLRYLGGSTNHWGGMTRPFDEIDFQRDYFGEEYKWPIKYKELNKYLSEACKILEIKNNFEYDGNYQNVKPIKFQFSTVQFKTKYEDFLLSSKNINLFLNSNLSDLNGENRTVKSIVLESFNKKKINISAKKFVFAMGGIENSRYLLWFQKKYNNKFFDSNVLIGKYWMEHPVFTLGKAFVKKTVFINQYYSLTKNPQIKKKILNCGLRMHGVSSNVSKQMLKNLLCTAPKIGEKIGTLLNKNLICGVKLRAAWEQSPSKNSYVKLSNENDMFGIPKIELNWTKNDLDRKTIKETVNTFNDWFLENENGRIQLSNWLLDDKSYPLEDELAGLHHMGGTRMAVSKNFGVIDENCKVFGSNNIYMAGSSIFVTGGHNNPTLPIVQFSLRLSDHILSKLI